LEHDLKNEIALVVCSSEIINAKNKVLFKRKSLLKAGVNFSRKVIRKSIMSGTNIIGEPMVGMFRHNLLDNKIEYASNKYMIDLDFWFKILQFGDLFFINKQLASFRISSDSLSSNLSFKQPFLFYDFAKQSSRKYNVPKINLVVGFLNSIVLGVLRNIIFAFAFKTK
jgi:hypothetical protein